MIGYMIKSTICLAVLLAFYHLLLKDIKTLVFNRFFLIFALLFALVIPLVSFETRLTLPGSSTISDISGLTITITEQDNLDAGQVGLLSLKNILLSAYLMISVILLLRFLFNLSRILRIRHKGRIAEGTKPSIVLVEKKIIPYSFMSSVFVNCSDYEEDKIPPELLLHEQAHCLQYHSLDILFIEFVRVVFWFNPFVWLLANAMKLNHEYLADDQVVIDHDIDNYGNQLINLVIMSNPLYLTSNFNKSFTKKRLIMITKNKPSVKAIFRKVATLPLFLLLAIVFTFSQQQNQVKQNVPVGQKNPDQQQDPTESNASSLSRFNGSEWWLPILQQENVELLAFNNFERVFEMGTKNMINDGVVRLENAFIILRLDNEGGY